MGVERENKDSDQSKLGFSCLFDFVRFFFFFLVCKALEQVFFFFFF